MRNAAFNQVVFQLEQYPTNHVHQLSCIRKKHNKKNLLKYVRVIIPIKHISKAEVLRI